MEKFKSTHSAGELYDMPKGWLGPFSAAVELMDHLVANETIITRGDVEITSTLCGIRE